MSLERWFASLYSRQSLSSVSRLAAKSVDSARQGYSTEKSPQGRCRGESSEEGNWDDGRLGGITRTKARFSYQPLRLDLQQEPSLQRGSSILRRVLSVLLSDGPRRPTDRPGLPWDLLERPWEDLGTTASQGIPDHVPHSPDPRQWSPQHGMSLPSTSMQHWTWIPREHFRRTRMLRATGRRFRLRNMIPSGKRSLLPGERSRSTLPRLRELQGPLCWTWVRQRFLTECPGWTSRLSRTPWRPRHG